ncbi:stage V sporulation protein AB [Halanaerobaculum tunisiense]
MLILIGLGEGVVVGTALIAFLLVLDVVPRLIRFSKANYRQVKIYQFLLLVGPLLATYLQFYEWKVPQIYPLNQLLVICLGFIFGSFIGLLAGALTEVLKVLPILSRRLGLENKTDSLLLIIIVGKAIGSLVYWGLLEL